MNKLSRILARGFGLGVLGLVLSLISTHLVRAQGPQGPPNALITLAYDTTVNCFKQTLYSGASVGSCFQFPQNSFLVLTDISFSAQGCSGTGAQVSLHTVGGQDVWRASLAVDAGGGLYTQTHFTTGVVFSTTPVFSVDLNGASCTPGAILVQGFVSPSPPMGK